MEGSGVVDVTYVKGNIVTPTGVVYGGYVEVHNDTIKAVGTNAAGLPALSALTATHRAAYNGDHNNGRAVHVSVVEAPWIVPGFVDIHNHGLGGCDEVCDHWAFPDLSQLELARSGTLSVVASVIFSSTRPEATQAVIASLVARTGVVLPDMCVVEGIHAEGPVIRDRGGLPAAESNLDAAEFAALCDTMGPALRIMTISPSVDAPNNYACIRELLRRGVRVSLGHDRHASEEEILGALRLSAGGGDGAEGGGNDQQMHTTHAFNVMSSHHRNPSLGNVILCRRFPNARRYDGCTVPTTEVIGDLIHVHPIVVQSLLSARDVRDVAVISDCISSYEPGKRLRYNGRDIAVRAEGGCYLCDTHGRATNTLAGSTVTLADQFYALITYFRLDVVAACRMLATNPARIAGIGDRVGAIASGLRANLLLLNGNMDTIERRMVYGRWVGAGPHRMLRPTPSHL